MTDYEIQVIAKLDELLTVQGNVYGLLVFFTVTGLCYFVYRFLKLFF